MPAILALTIAIGTASREKPCSEADLETGVLSRPDQELVSGCMSKRS
jgi:hypothetical protein